MIDLQTIDQIGEEKLIEMFRAEAGALGSKVLVKNGDDAAAWFVEPRYASVITTDAMVEGVHFDLSYTEPRSVGRKLISTSLSDLASMGATPRYALLAVSFPTKTLVKVAAGIALGARTQCKDYGVAIIGGNTTRTDGPIHLTATLIGRAQPDELVTRRGTQAGDAIFVTGNLGSARAGFELAKRDPGLLRASDRRVLLEALTNPKPRVKAGRDLAKKRAVHAMCDISDGLSRDLRHLLVPEALGAKLQARALPILEPVRNYAVEAGLSVETVALEGGEDYELLFTAAPEDERLVRNICASTATPVSKIGVATAKSDLEIEMADGRTIPVPTGGFVHF